MTTVHYPSSGGFVGANNPYLEKNLLTFKPHKEKKLQIKYKIQMSRGLNSTKYM